MMKIAVQKVIQKKEAQATRTQEREKESRARTIAHALSLALFLTRNDKYCGHSYVIDNYYVSDYQRIQTCLRLRSALSCQSVVRVRK